MVFALYSSPWAFRVLFFSPFFTRPTRGFNPTSSSLVVVGQGRAAFFPSLSGKTVDVGKALAMVAYLLRMINSSVACLSFFCVRPGAEAKPAGSVRIAP